MFDLCMMREQFSNRIQQWKRTVVLVTFENIQGYEYFHEGESDLEVGTEIDVFIMTDNSDYYDHKTEGAIKTTEYMCYADYDVTITNQDFIKFNSSFFKIKDLKRILHPVSGEEIGKEFKLERISITEE